MPTSKILALGGTGPAGICLLRELLHRNHTVVAYARSPSKIPTDLSSNPHLSVVKGEMNDLNTFSTAINSCSTIISHLGAQITDTHIAPSMYADIYRKTVVPAMRNHGVKRIFLMGTMAIQRPEEEDSAWRKGREEGKLYVGPLGAKGWTMNTNRSLLARWLVDSAESGAPEWVRKMPAVTRLAGS
ncbi:hypothetical protein EJ07DRAFT_167496 [Lizonia empirigonia]|nr:hypothetical protein EJ07DRAFT_167496 [Lizonia empirigonia]